MKKYIIGALIALSALVGFYAYAAPPVQQGYQGGTGISTSSFGSILVGPGGSFFNSYNQLALGSNGQCLQASSTSATGLIWASCASGSTGITSLNGLTGATQTFATGTATGIGLSIVSSGSTHTFTPTVSSGYIIPLSASTTNWNNNYNNINALTNGYVPYASSTGPLQNSPIYTNGNNISVAGNASATNFTDSSLTNGNCVQAGAGGLLTTTSSACGSGGGSGTVLSSSSSTVPIYFGNGTTLGGAPESYYETGEGSAGYGFVVGTNGSPYNIPAFGDTRVVDNTAQGSEASFLDMKSFTSSTTNSTGGFIDKENIGGNNGSMDHTVSFQDTPVITQSVGIPDIYGFVSTPQIGGGANGARIAFEANPAIVTNTPTTTVYEDIGFDCPSEMGAETGVTEGWCFASAGQNNIMKGLLLGDQNSYIHDKTASLEIESNSANAKLRLGNTSGDYWDLYATGTPSNQFVIGDYYGQVVSVVSSGGGSTGGKVGINTTSPSQNFVVVGTTNITGTSTFATTTINGTLTVPSIANCNSTQYLQITSGLFGCGTPAGGGGGLGTTSPFSAGYIPEATGTNVTLTNSNIFQSTNGNIGIATITPAALLQISGTTNAPYLLLQNTNASSSYANNEPSFVANGNMGGLEIDLQNATSTATTTVLKLSGSNNQNGPGGVAIGYNAGKNWDYSKNYNASGGYIAPIFIGYEAGQNMTASTTASGPSGPQDNPFGSIFIGDQNEYLATAGLGGNLAGETTVVGSEAMVDNFGGSNAVLGYDSGLGCINCADSVLVGDDIMDSATTTSNSVLIGDSVGTDEYGNNNVFVGYETGVFRGSVASVQGDYGIDNVYLGTYAGTNQYNTTSPVTAQSYNVKIGFQSSPTGTSTNETIIGSNAGGGAQTVTNSPNCYEFGPLSGCGTHINNSILGYNAAGLNNSGNNNLILGYGAAYDATSSSNNIVIGYNTDLPTSNSSSTLDIGNLIYGTGLTNFSSPTAGVSAGNVGIGTSTPQSELVVQVPSIAFIASSYPYANAGTLPLDSADYTGAGNTFTAANGKLNSVQFDLDKAGTVSGNVVAYIYNISGTPGTNAIPTGAALATSTPVVASSLPSSIGLVTFTFSGANAITLTAGTTYFVDVEYSNTTSPNQVNFQYGSTAFANQNIAYNSGGWFGTGALNGVFYLFETPLPNNNPIFVVASTTGTSLFQVKANGDVLDNELTSGNCMQAGAGGLLTTTSSACGSGGSGNSAWTIGNGLIYNATSTDLVGIGTITPTTTLFVQGKGGTNPFVIASSTGSVLFTVNQQGQMLGSNAGNSVLYGFNGGTGGLASDGSNGDTLFAGGNGDYLFSDTRANFTRQLQSGAFGGAASPDFTGSNFPTAGIYFSNSTSTMGISTAGISRMFFDTSGNVGINSSTPTALLTLQGYSGATTDLLNIATNTGVSLLKVLSNGNVGIGSSTPNANLVVQASAAQTTALFTVASSSGAGLLTVTPCGASCSSTYNLLVVGTSTAPNLFVLNSIGDTFLNHLIGSSTLPTIATSTGDGATAGTATVFAGSTDLAGSVTAVTSNAPAANATIWTLTFNRGFAAAPFCTVTSNTSTPSFIEDIWTTTTATTLILKSSTTALTGTSTYEATYQCIGQQGG